MLSFVSSRTGQQVKRAAVGADGFVLDHFSREAIEDHLHDVGRQADDGFWRSSSLLRFQRLLEVYGVGLDARLCWTNFASAAVMICCRTCLSWLTISRRIRGVAVRHDWGETLTELIDENYLKPINAWATRITRSSAPRPMAILLSRCRVTRLWTCPKARGPQWRQFSDTRWATSASHVYGRPVTSSETWTWLHSPAFRATPLDMKAEADRFFLQGINQLIGHGWPYSPPSAGEPGWRFYAAGAFNAHNPWWIVMPDVTRYLQRVSWILRQGEPANQVAVYLPEDDAWAAFTPGKVSLTELMPRWITPALTQAIEDGGYNFDYIDSAAIAARGIHYPVLILPNVDRISPATLARIAEYQQHGGKVIAVGHLPAHAPGLQEGMQASAQVAAAAAALFSTSGGNAQFIAQCCPASTGATAHAAARHAAVYVRVWVLAWARSRAWLHPSQAGGCGPLLCRKHRQHPGTHEGALRRRTWFR